MPDLFDGGYPSAPGFKDDDTAKAAAASMVGQSKLLRVKVLKALEAMPMTADEVAWRVNENVLSIRPRFTELLRAGKIEDTGKRRANRSGRQAKVWGLV